MVSFLRKIRSIADYQFGRNIGFTLFPERVRLAHSKRTGRIRYIYLDDKRLVTLRPNDGLYSLSLEGARRILGTRGQARCLVSVVDEASEYVAHGRNAFAKHVVKADKEIRPGDEVIVVDKSNRLLAVGRAVLSGEEMEAFRRGVAVKVRLGCLEEG